MALTRVAPSPNRMKALIKLTIFAVAVVAATALWWRHAHPQPDPGITRVLEARQAARQACLLPRGRFRYAIFTGRLNAISAQDCPKEFRLAWLDYQSAWTRQTNDRRRNGGAAELDLLGAVFEPHMALVQLLKAAREEHKPVFDTASAWLGLQREAIIYNCQIPPDRQ